MPLGDCANSSARRRAGQHAARASSRASSSSAGTVTPRPARPPPSARTSPSGEHHREPGPQVVEDPGPERIAGLDVVEVRAHGDVGIEEEIGPLPVGRPAGVEEHVLAGETKLSPTAPGAAAATRIAGTAGLGWRMPRNTRRSSGTRRGSDARPPAAAKWGRASCRRRLPKARPCRPGRCPGRRPRSPWPCRRGGSLGRPNGTTETRRARRGSPL